mgnify:CR=1 FL=1
MKKLMLGNEAVARGLYEAGCSFVSSYPGTPSTEITEAIAKYPEVSAEWAPNEKVALESAFGASLAGRRSFCGMKHVGLNVAADPLFTISYTGVNAGMVILVADDPGMHSSQNEQDSRHYAMGSKTMMLEPSDSAECLDFTKRAFELSEKFDTPVIIRLTTRVAHSRSVAELSERVDNGLKEYTKNPQKYVMVPANAKGKHVVVENRILAQTEFCEKEAVEIGLNTVEYNSKKIATVLDDLYFVDDYKVTKKYPSRLVIQLFKRKPLARITGKDGEIFFVDRRGVIFKSSKIKGMIPLLILENPQQVHQGKKLGGKFAELIQQLYLLNQKYNNLYQQIAQITVRKRNEILEYNIDFRIINKTLALKKN